MKVLAACEFSGVVRDAFRAHGHEAWSLDLLPSEARTTPHHIQGDMRHVHGPAWDMIIAFPPCTHLCVSGARWWPEKEEEQADAIRFVRWIADLECPRIAIENPIGILSTAWREPDQIVQPWQFGHGETKATCFWLKGLPPLQAMYSEAPDLFLPDAPVERVPRVWREPPSSERWKNRSRTYWGIAEAMADQWGSLPNRH
jgi:hypothetical protein